MHPMTTNESPSKKIVLQRIRNRIIEVLDLFADDEAFDIAVNNLEFWADWVDGQSLGELMPPVFTAGELVELAKVNAAWELVERTSLPNSKEWLVLSQSAKQALRVFLARGKLSESSENA
jgi:hypothetical protein